MYYISQEKFMITLAQKIEDVKILLARLRKGWEEKNIFEVEGCEYSYPNNKIHKSFYGEVHDGWSTIIRHLGDLLGFDAVGLDDNGHRSPCSPSFSEQEIRILMWEAEAFISLMGGDQETKQTS